MAVLKFIQNIMQRGPRRLGDAVTEIVPGMEKVRNPLNGALNGAPVVGRFTGAAAGSVVIGLVSMYAAWWGLTELVL